MELNLGPVTNVPAPDRCAASEIAWGHGGPCDPYQRTHTREPGLRDGFSRKDPEVDGLGTGIKVTRGANIDKIQVMNAPKLEMKCQMLR